MKLIEALEVLKHATTSKAEPFSVCLVSSFTPLHLQTFLGAELQALKKTRQVQITTGLYGDIRGNLSRLIQAKPDAAVIVLEWQDFDARLGLRSLGSWEPSQLPEIAENFNKFSSFLLDCIKNRNSNFAISVSCPTLPLPPISYGRSWQSSKFELLIHECLANLLTEISQLENVFIVSPSKLDILSPPADRLDAKSEYAAGFPYRLSHASVLAKLHALQIAPPEPKKGLISDLDDTLWQGILGEVGVNRVSWDLEHGALGHGAYQRFLQALAETGILVAVASKNNAQLVQEAFQRSDMLLSARSVYPIEANWGPKSASVARILKLWNVTADSVVFIDDSPMELAEVRAAHPDILCLQYPKTDANAALQLQYDLRDLFGKRSLSEEDALRVNSIRQAEQFRAISSEGCAVSDDFLRDIDAELTLDFGKTPADPRALELVNKTNQFNLNGRRFSEGEWLEYLQKDQTFLVLVSYRDKYGPLGKISVIAGQMNATKSLNVDVWVLSCRAFSRKIEHRLLSELFSRFAPEEIVFKFSATPKNGPLQEFLKEQVGEDLDSPVLTKNHFNSVNKLTYHAVLETKNG